MNSAKRKQLKRERITDWVVNALGWSAVTLGAWFILWSFYWCSVVILQLDMLL